jgi:hypothetical protein
MSLITIIYFFIMMIFLGYTIYKLLNIKIGNNPYEKTIMILGFGIATFPILSIIFNTIKIPLHFMIFLIISSIIPLINLYKYISNKKFNLTLKNEYINTNLYYFLIVLIFSIILFSVFLYGSNKYEYLENDDPWYHAEGTKYVSVFKTYSVSEPFTRYLEPYPPSYDVLMGVLHQLNTKVQWTLKFFNSLLIGLSILFFYYFSEKFFRNKNIALISSFLLTIIPCYLSHFIWAQSYSLIMYPIAFYILNDLILNKNKKIKENIKLNYKLIIAFGIFSSSIYVMQPSSALIFLIFSGLFFLGSSIFRREIQYLIILALITGLIISLVYWVPTQIKFSDSENTETIESLQKVRNLFDKEEKFELRLGEQTNTYSFKDFETAQKHSKIDQAIGIGKFLFYIFIASLILIILILSIQKMKNEKLLISLLWLIFTFLGVQGNEFPINLIPHRFWAFFAIPVVMISAYGLYYLINIKMNKIIKITLIIIIIIGIIVTSAYPKYIVQTSIWPPGVDKWSSNEQLEGYIYLKNNFEGITVFPLCEHDSIPIGFNLMSYGWDSEVKKFRENLQNKTLEDLIMFLKIKNYDYYIITTNCLNNVTFKSLGENKTNEFFQTGNYLSYNNQGFYLFKVP